MLLPELLDGAPVNVSVVPLLTAYATEGSCITPSTDTSISSSEPTAWSSVNAVVEPSPENCVAALLATNLLPAVLPKYGIM
jgi:hypothetical protein